MKTMSNDTSPPALKVVGEIRPPDYMDPVTMLRNIADKIEAGDYSDVTTVAVALSTENGIETFGGGRHSDVYISAYLFGAAHNRLLNIQWGSS